MNDWAYNIKLCSSTVKSAAMRISHNETAARPTFFLGGTSIKTVRALPILGVAFSCSLNFSAYVTSTVCKHRPFLGFVSRVSLP